MQETQKDLELVVKGKKVTIPKDDHYFTEDGRTPVIKHAPLKRLAKHFGVGVDRVVLEFSPIYTPEGMWVSHRAFGRDENGHEVSAIGEASPYNTEGIALQYPIIMSNKRAEDRLLIALLDLEGVVYSENEIPEANNQGAVAPNPANADLFTFGRKHPGKTIDEVIAVDRQYAEWFATKFQARNPKDKSLQDRVRDRLATA